jgi:AP-4 complex subunit epsilon-1
VYLQVLAILGKGDRAVSEGMYEVLRDVMRRADTGVNVGYAVSVQVDAALSFV